VDTNTILSYTQYWNNEFIQNTKFIKRNSLEIVLEIGCFEGLTSNYIADNLLSKRGRLYCADPLEDRYLVENLDEHATFLNNSIDYMNGQYDRFIENTSQQTKIRLIRSKSDEAWAQLTGWQFDLIYIDGDHRPEQVYKDAVNALNHVKHHGFILFDDYLWKTENFAVRDGVDRFFKDHYRRIEELFCNSQLMIRRIG
jgi:predicted O-methyltransferase YrrM